MTKARKFVFNVFDGSGYWVRQVEVWGRDALHAEAVARWEHGTNNHYMLIGEASND